MPTGCRTESRHAALEVHACTSRCCWGALRPLIAVSPGCSRALAPRLEVTRCPIGARRVSRPFLVCCIRRLGLPKPVIRRCTEAFGPLRIVLVRRIGACRVPRTPNETHARACSLRHTQRPNCASEKVLATPIPGPVARARDAQWNVSVLGSSKIRALDVTRTIAPSAS